MLKLILIRHATSLGNQEFRMMGQLDDELSAVGIAESQQLARLLVGMGDRPSVVYCSPQRRATQTAQILLTPWLNDRSQGSNPASEQSEKSSFNFDVEQAPCAIPIRLCDDLKELNGGIFEGLTWAQAQTQHPELCQQLEQTMDWIPVPGGESPQAGFHRARRFLHHLIHEHTAEVKSSDAVIWIVSHSGILQHLIAALLGCDRTWGLTIPNTARFEFWLDGDRWHSVHQLGQHRRNQNLYNTALWQIRRFNDISHLR